LKYTLAILANHETQSFKEACQDQNWLTTMSKEIQALQEKKNTRHLTKLPIGKVPIGYKWVYKVKHKADETVERYKA